MSRPKIMTVRKQISVYCDESDASYLESIDVGSTKFFRMAIEAHKKGEWKLPVKEEEKEGE